MRALRVVIHVVVLARVVAALLGYRVELDHPHVFLHSGGPLARLDRPHLDALEVDILTCFPLVVLHVRFEFLRGQRIADIGELFEFAWIRHCSVQLLPRLSHGTTARVSLLRHLRLSLLDAAVTSGGAMLTLGERVGVLEHAAAWARLLHRSVEHTYLAVPVLVVVGFALRVDALVALPTALVLHLVDADDLWAALANEALVRPLAIIVTVLEELWELLFRLCLLDRLITDVVVRRFHVVIRDLELDTVHLVLQVVLRVLMLFVV